MAQSALFGDYPREPEPQEIHQALAESAYAPIPSALGRSDYGVLFDSFASFSDLVAQPGGEALAQAVQFKSTDDDRGDYYFLRRRAGDLNPVVPGRGIGTDHKDVLHFGPQTRDRARSELGGALPAEMEVFLAQCDEVYEEVCRIGRVATRALDMEGIFFSGDRQDDVHILRLIQYLNTGVVSVGEAHFDRSAFTTTRYESLEGLRGVPAQNGYLEPIDDIERYLTKIQGQMSPIDYSEFLANFFLGAGFNRLPQELRDRVRADLLAHDITAVQPGTPRQSAVGFYNPHRSYPEYSVPTKYETGFGDIAKKIGSVTGLEVA